MARNQTFPTITVRHSCGDKVHTAEFTPTRVVKLGCGCTRNEGTRCDGTPMHALHLVACAYHQETEAEGDTELNMAASA